MTGRKIENWKALTAVTNDDLIEISFRRRGITKHTVTIEGIASFDLNGNSTEVSQTRNISRLDSHGQGRAESSVINDMDQIAMDLEDDLEDLARKLMP